MEDVPTPTDLLVQTLVWLGLPSLLLAPIILVLAGLEWIKLARSSVSLARRTGISMTNLYKRASWVKIAFVIAVQGITVASIFAASRFLVVLFAPDSPLIGGPHFRWQELWVSLINYSDSTSFAITAMLITLGWVIAFDLFTTLNFKPTSRLLGIVRIPVVGLAMFATLGWTVLFIVVWFLAAGDDPQYNYDMMSVYGVGAVTSGLVAASLGMATVAAERIFAWEF